MPQQSAEVGPITAISALGHEQTSRHVPRHVRYSRQSGHSSARFARPLSARSRHGLAEGRRLMRALIMIAVATPMCSLSAPWVRIPFSPPLPYPRHCSLVTFLRVAFTAPISAPIELSKNSAHTPCGHELGNAPRNLLTPLWRGLYLVGVVLWAIEKQT
jgi:hypothetical protein